jgi:hypothetical protein
VHVELQAIINEQLPLGGVNDGTNSVKRDAYRTWRNLHEVNIFRVTRGRPEVQLVECGSAAKGEPFGDVGNSENLNKCTAYYQILFDLRVLNPWSVLTPLRDVVLGYQRSGSTLALIASFQRSSRRARAVD